MSYQVSWFTCRHLSHNSMALKVTFPIHQDSYTATDISPQFMTDRSPSNSPTTTLPYPSLAHGVGIWKHASRTFALDSSVASLSASSRSLGGGFFASIGRKASMKKDHPLPSAAPIKLMPSRQASQPPQPQPIKLGAQCVHVHSETGVIVHNGTTPNPSLRLFRDEGPCICYFHPCHRRK